MLATTIQITNNPPHTTHTNNTTVTGWLRRQPPPTQAADAHTVLNVNPTVCLKAPHHQTAAEGKRFIPNPKTHPHPPPHCRGSKHMQAQENNQHNPTGHAACSPLNGLPRKEVIQPHLPVRLPCYDFVPIANPTFDHSPRTSRLGHGLRVLPTFVT